MDSKPCTVKPVLSGSIIELKYYQWILQAETQKDQNWFSMPIFA